MSRHPQAVPLQRDLTLIGAILMALSGILSFSALWYVVRFVFWIVWGR